MESQAWACKSEEFSRRGEVFRIKLFSQEGKGHMTKAARSLDFSKKEKSFLKKGPQTVIQTQDFDSRIQI